MEAPGGRLLVIVLSYCSQCWLMFGLGSPPPLSFSLFISLSLSIFPFPLLKKKITQNALGVEFPVFLFDPKIHIVAAYAAHLHRSLTTEIYMIQ